MQKKLIALAAAGLIAAPVMAAESTVTLYGLIDLGYKSVGKSKTYNAATNTYTSTGESVFSQASSTMNGGRLGVKGSEMLGNGLQGNFKIEAGQSTDTGAGGLGGTLRVSTVGFSGGFGSIDLGRQYTPTFSLHAAIDPSGVGGPANYGGAHQSQTRASNSLAYKGNFSGLKVAFLYATDGARDEDETLDSNGDVVKSNTNKDDVVYTDLTLSYAMDNWMVGVGYANAEVSRSVADEIDGTGLETMTLGGTYNLGSFKLHAMYSKSEESSHDFDAAAADTPTEEEAMSLSASASFGGNQKAWLSVGDVTQDVAGTDNDPNRTIMQLGYVYNLSKRTDVYAVYGSEKDEYGYEDSYTPSTINVGVRHRF